MNNRIDYINSSDVVELITTNKQHLKYLIIDVRTSDIDDLVIHTAINIPYNNFRSTANSIASMYQFYDLIIIYCMHSQTRGPASATILNNEFIKSKYQDSLTQIKILRKGFHGFYNDYWERKELFDIVK
ncbi:Rhodanese domain-containing protein [Entamoeba marina]